MAVTITIRGVPDEVRDELAARAASSGRSLQEYLSLQLRALVARPSLDDVVSRARARTNAVGRRLSAEEILDARDADRR
jgi:hypothetical protein